MDKDFFLNTGLHFEPPLPSQMPTWQSLTSAPEPNYFLTPNWEKSTEQYPGLQSALSSMVSSPATSNSAVSNDSFAIRELIGKLGTICNAGETSLVASAAATPYIGGGNNSTNTSCYTTPLNSPPKLHIPIMEQFVNEKLPNLGNSMPLNPSLLAVSADPGFAERAAKFSRFGSRSFNGRTGQFGLTNTEFPRVSSSPSLQAAGSQMGAQGNKNSGKTHMEMNSGNGSVSVSDKKFSRLSGPATNSNEDSSVSEQNPSGEIGFKSPNDLNSRKRKAVSRGKVKDAASSKSANATKEQEADDDSNAKRSKLTEGSGQENGSVETEETEDAADEGKKQSNSNSKAPEPSKDYIHVRARRGQATDSHSLAERVRREKISERMKLLQDLVPSCNKVIGKALMLDEIINYVQSLQRQVEFLSMKLASVNPGLDFDMNSLLSKDILQQNGTLPHYIYPAESSASAFYGHQPQQNPQVHTNISNGTVSQCSVDQLDATLCRNFGIQLSHVDGFGEGLPQFHTFCEDDLQSIVQMGFVDNPNRDTAIHSQNFQAPNQTSHMKIEL